MLFPTAYASLVPSVDASATTNQQKGLAIINNVIGLDTTKYDVITKVPPISKHHTWA
jgi:hypothetical protein